MSLEGQGRNLYPKRFFYCSSLNKLRPISLDGAFYWPHLYVLFAYFSKVI